MVPVECVQVRPADMLAEHHTIEDQVIESDLDGTQARTWLGKGGDRATCQGFLSVGEHSEYSPSRTGTDRRERV